MRVAASEPSASRYSTRTRARARRSASDCASTMLAAGNVDVPIARIFPARNRSVSNDRVSSMSVSVRADEAGTRRDSRFAGDAGSLQRRSRSSAGSRRDGWIVAHRMEDFRADHDAIAPSLQRLAHDLFRFAMIVGVSSVDVVDASVQRPLNHPDAFVVIRIASLSKQHRAKTVGTDLTSWWKRVTSLSGRSRATHAHSIRDDQ